MKLTSRAPQYTPSTFMNLTVDRSLLTRRPAQITEIEENPDQQPASSANGRDTKPELSPPAVTRPPTEKGVNRDRKRLQSSDVREDEIVDVSGRKANGEPSRKKAKLARIDNEGNPVRDDDDAVTATSNDKPQAKKRDASKQNALDKKNEPDVDMDFFSAPSKEKGVVKRPAATSKHDKSAGGDVNLSKKTIAVPSVRPLGPPRNGSADTSKAAAVPRPRPAPRPAASDGLFIKKKKVRDFGFRGLELETERQRSTAYSTGRCSIAASTD